MYFLFLSFNTCANFVMINKNIKFIGNSKMQKRIMLKNVGILSFLYLYVFY